MWDSGEGLLAQEPGPGTCYTSWDRKVAAGTITGRVSAKQSRSTNSKSKATWNAWDAPVAFWNRTRWGDKRAEPEDLTSTRNHGFPVTGHDEIDLPFLLVTDEPESGIRRASG